MFMFNSGRASRQPQAMPSSIAGTSSSHAAATGRKIDRLAVRMIFWPSKAKYLGVLWTVQKNVKRIVQDGAV